jgi:pimeloyl-ACP methyl ester carboxylesterase
MAANAPEKEYMMTSSSAGIPPHFIVIVPGFMGSELRHRETGELAWPALSSIPRNPFQWRGWVENFVATLTYPNDDLIPTDLIHEVVFIPPWAKQEHYGRLIRALDDMGYRTELGQHPEQDLEVYNFPYDWRQDNRKSAEQLGEAIERWRVHHPGAKVWIVAHSNGGLVARWYIEKLGGKETVGRMFLMGSPWDGVPKAMQMLFGGLDMLFLRRFNLFNIPRLTRDAIRTFPSVYQLLPHQDPFLRDPNNELIDLFTQQDWLDDEEQRDLLDEGRRFNDELGTEASVETLCFFGVKKPTTTFGLVQAIAQGNWQDITWGVTTAGDGTVPERSAVHPNAREKLPFSVGHGDIYVNPSVLEKLEWELVRRFQGFTLAEATTEHLNIMFEPEKDAYEPGEPIDMWATVHNRHSGLPVLDATIDVQLVWRQALPGEPENTAPPEPLTLSLEGSVEVGGRYEGTLIAPEREGYYVLEATVEAAPDPPVLLEELILVERLIDPDQLRQSEEEEAEVSAPAPDGAAAEEETAGGLESLEAAWEDEDEWDDEEPPSFLGRRFGFDAPAFEPEWVGAEPPPAAPIPAPPAMPEQSSGGSAPSPAEPAPPAAANGAQEQRWITGEIRDHDPALPLRVGEVYELGFGVGQEAARGEIRLAELDHTSIFGSGDDLVELKVYLSATGFRLYSSQPQSLWVPRRGRSRGKAIFNIEPEAEGAGEITALFYKDHNFIQGMILKLNCGTGDGLFAASPESLGRSPAAIFAVRPRELSLFVEKKEAGFKTVMVGSVYGEATLPLTSDQLAYLVGNTRKELLEIVRLGVGPHGVQPYPPTARIPRDVTLPYQSGIDIPEEVAAEALHRLARAGWSLYNNLFLRERDPSAMLLGERLRELAERNTLKVQIISRELLLPWGVLYLSEEPPRKDNIEWERFLGFKHIIEHIPLQRQMTTLDSTIPSQPRLAVGVNVDPDIDQEMRTTLIQDQLGYWKALEERTGAQVAVRQTEEEVLGALRDPATADQILYFFCHAKAGQLSDPGGPKSSSLRLSGNKLVTLQTLEFEAASSAFQGSPLVFINACESAELSPLFYDGFMPYFTSRGARGMIGTECEVPAIFAAEWAHRFFDRFLGTERPVGQVFLELRRDFYQKHNNLLGLLYALYCDEDTRVRPGLRVGE